MQKHLAQLIQLDHGVFFDQVGQRLKELRPPTLAFITNMDGRLPRTRLTIAQVVAQFIQKNRKNFSRRDAECAEQYWPRKSRKGTKRMVDFGVVAGRASLRIGKTLGMTYGIADHKWTVRELLVEVSDV